jgi:hypothetical protein
MSYDLSAKQLKLMIAALPEARVKDFVRRAQQTREIWTLAEGDALLVLGSEGSPQFVVVWPHPDYALSWFEESGLEEADLVAMSLDDWIESTLDELAEAEIDLNVFPTLDSDGEMVSAKQMLARLRTNPSEQDH